MKFLLEVSVSIIGKTGLFAIYELPGDRYFCKHIWWQEPYNIIPAPFTMCYDKKEKKWICDIPAHNNIVEYLGNWIEQWFNLPDYEKDVIRKTFRTKE